MTTAGEDPDTLAGAGAGGGDPIAGRLVVVGASAGGIAALARLLGDLPVDLDVAIAVVEHLAPGVPSVLPRILQRSTPLHVVPGGDGVRPRAGHVYVAVPDYHLVVGDDGLLRLDGGLTENGFRPSVDRLFRTAAQSFGPRVLGVVLSGSLHDGAAGARAVELGGGSVAVQDPQDADHRSMPEASLEVVERAFVGTPEQIADWVIARVEVRQVPSADPPSFRQGPADDPPDDRADELVAARRPVTEGGRDPWVACPECHGARREVDDLGMARDRCLTGHTWSPRSLLARPQDEVERSAVAALRDLSEQVEPDRRLLQRSEQHGRVGAAAGFAVRAREAEQAITAMGQMLGTVGSTLGDVTP